MVVMKKLLRESYKVKVLYFAEIKEILQKSKDEFDFKEALTVEDFVEFLNNQYPQINHKKYQIAINEEFSQYTDEINPNDTIALIPPVSGG